MNFIKNNFIILTGGPGSGKTTLLHALQEKGIQYVEETARPIIRERLNQGLSPRPDPQIFAIKMFERDHQNFIENLDQTETLFFDRSFLDSAALIHDTNKKYFDAIKNILISCRFNNKVFITPPWKEIYTTDDERDQTFGESVKVYEKLSAWYESNGYTLITIPRVTMERRVDFILNEIQD